LSLFFTEYIKRGLFTIITPVFIFFFISKKGKVYHAIQSPDIKDIKIGIIFV